MDELKVNSALNAANSARKRGYGLDELRELKEESEKLEGKKIKKRQILSSRDKYILTGGLALAILFAGLAYSMAERDLVGPNYGGDPHVGFSDTHAAPKDVLRHMINMLKGKGEIEFTTLGSFDLSDNAIEDPGISQGGR